MRKDGVTTPPAQRRSGPMTTAGVPAEGSAVAQDSGPVHAPGSWPAPDLVGVGEAPVQGSAAWSPQTDLPDPGSGWASPTSAPQPGSGWAASSPASAPPGSGWAASSPASAPPGSAWAVPSPAVAAQGGSGW